LLLSVLLAYSCRCLFFSEDDGQPGRTYWLWAESKHEVEAWIEALRYSQQYYKHKQEDQQHAEQHMELGTSS
jgi:hypothetical protein